MTIIRFGALHDWPQLRIRAVAVAFTVSSRSSVSSTISGSDPPSSRTAFLRFRPASVATEMPACSLPVSDTPTMRGSARTDGTCRLDANVLTYTSSGTPASCRTVSIAAADRGQIDACLSRIVLPSTRFGATNRATW